jgi:hypothetical protein
MLVVKRMTRVAVNIGMCQEISEYMMSNNCLIFAIQNLKKGNPKHLRTKELKTLHLIYIYIGQTECPIYRP